MALTAEGLEATELYGAPAQRVRAMGAALRPRIQTRVAAWLGALRTGGVGEPEAYVEAMRGASPLSPLTKVSMISELAAGSVDSWIRAGPPSAAGYRLYAPPASSADAPA